MEKYYSWKFSRHNCNFRTDLGKMKSWKIKLRQERAPLKNMYFDIQLIVQRQSENCPVPTCDEQNAY